jgi:hypothetical protein
MESQEVVLSKGVKKLKKVPNRKGRGNHTENGLTLGN